MSDKNRYRDTLNLPRTDFAMRGNLAKREPERLQHWKDRDIYGQLRKARAGKPKFVLHDGPPYANGNIHIGHVVNKVLKDMVVRTWSLEGHDAPYRPGWDCHGLPIELQIEKMLSPAERANGRAFRAACRAYAAEQIDRQRQDFIRLGVWGQWDNPYLTMDFKTEANIVRALGELLRRNYLFRGHKPVYWCADCGSALAEAEVEYQEHVSHAIDVCFDAADERLAQAFGLPDDTRISMVIWTTTPWTLPANEAVCLHPDFDYVCVSHGDRSWVVAKDLCESFCERTGAVSGQSTTVAGRKLERLNLRHPFMDRTVPVINGSHVTAEEGTGCVHTAPAHGPEDYLIARQYDLPADCPVGVDGRFGQDIALVAEMTTQEANSRLLDHLEEIGQLASSNRYPHSYPHCWRHRTPLIYRTAPQWFIGMDNPDLRKNALAAVDQVNWYPAWGAERIRGMIASRPDWCISRQRSWGTPIPLFWHRETEALHPKSQELIEQVAKRIERDGIDAWFELDPKELLGADAPDYIKSPDTLDVWFDSGVTHCTVLEEDASLAKPADLYLEGSDQHRGWFQSSLLTAVALDGVPPYRAVLTHGFVVDAKGRKMAKSLGNVVEPQKIIDRLGADILRLWVAATDTSRELTVSDEILGHISEAYRRIRNTARYLLSSLSDFDPSDHRVPANQMLALDQWIVAQAVQIDTELREAYRSYEHHRVYQRLHTFCVTELGSLYLDITKDRTYTLPVDHPARRSAQTAMYALVELLSRWLAPICPFTADEIYEQIPGPREESVHLTEWFDASGYLPGQPVLSDRDWSWLLEARQRVSQVLEPLRQSDVIGSGLDAEVTLWADSELMHVLQQLGDELHFLLITSSVSWADASISESTSFRVGEHELQVQATASLHKKCVRCWHHCASVGSIDDHPELCQRCHANIEGSGETRQYV